MQSDVDNTIFLPGELNQSGNIRTENVTRRLVDGFSNAGLKIGIGKDNRALTFDAETTAIRSTFPVGSAHTRCHSAQPVMSGRAMVGATISQIAIDTNIICVIGYVQGIRQIRSFTGRQ